MRTFSESFNYGYASALATISTLLMMLGAFFYISATENSGKEASYDTEPWLEWRRERLSRIFLFRIPLILFLCFMLFPFYWIVNTSLKGSTEVFALPIKYWPSHPTLENFVYLFTVLGLDRNFVNSAIVAVATLLIVSVLSLLSGYAMSRYKFRGKGVFYVLMLVTQMLPAVVLMIPLFQTMNQLHLINNLWSLIIICSCTNLAYCMFMMMGYFNAVPRELEEAAMIDGVSLLGAIFRILLPVMKPSIVATGAYAFINAWNVYVYATAFITRKEKYTLPLALKVLQGEYGTDYGALAAGCVIAIDSRSRDFRFHTETFDRRATAGAYKVDIEELLFTQVKMEE
jgi:multiple sugar transport system permease protein